jgi:hypothetical protein
MDDSKKLDVYRAQTANVRALDRAWRSINRSTNLYLKKGDSLSSEVHTKVLALVFCAWAEASFSKIIHTPYGFANHEIAEINAAHRKSLESGWQKCIDLALARISVPSTSSTISDIRSKLLSIIQEFVVDPRELRNKIAHGQWVVALNSTNTAVNPNASSRIQDLDAVAVTVWRGVFRRLATIVECLIESPDHAFHRDYESLARELEVYVGETSRWSLDEKTRLLTRREQERD